MGFVWPDANRHAAYAAKSQTAACPRRETRYAAYQLAGNGLAAPLLLASRNNI